MLTIGFLACWTVLTSLAGPIDGPRKTAGHLYRIVVDRKLTGLPNKNDMQELAPYLSNSLKALFELASKKQSQHMRENPGDKPPWADGCLFSCLFEGPVRFQIARVERSGRYALVAVKQAGEGQSEFGWVDTVVLLMENEKWVVWDIRMGCDWPFRMGPTLRSMLQSGLE